MQTLVSVSTIGTQDQLSDEQLAEEVKAELGAWFGAGRIKAWKLLRVYRIPFAQPNQAFPQALPSPTLEHFEYELWYEMYVVRLLELIPGFSYKV